MKTFLRIVERVILHLYFIGALALALVFLLNEVSYNRAAFALLAVQAEALLAIADTLRGHAI